MSGPWPDANINRAVVKSGSYCKVEQKIFTATTNDIHNN